MLYHHLSCFSSVVNCYPQKGFVATQLYTTQEYITFGELRGSEGIWSQERAQLRGHQQILILLLALSLSYRKLNNLNFSFFLELLFSQVSPSPQFSRITTQQSNVFPHIIEFFSILSGKIGLLFLV